MRNIIHLGLLIACGGFAACSTAESEAFTGQPDTTPETLAKEVADAGAAEEAAEGVAEAKAVLDDITNGAADPGAEDPSTEDPGTEDTSAASSEAPAEGDWVVGATIPSGRDGVPPIEVLHVHQNGTGPKCGTGKNATVRYKAMKANGSVLDPGRAPYSFRVGPGNAIKAWHIIVAEMRVGDSFTVSVPQDLAYGPSRGDLKFDMELLSFK